MKTALPRLLFWAISLTSVWLPVRAQSQGPPFSLPGLPFWEWQQPQPTGYGLFDFHAFNDSTIIAVGGHGTAVKTANNGRTWQQLPTGAERTLTSVSFINNAIGWIGAETEPTTARHYQVGAGRLLYTTDGGQTWLPQNIGEPTLSVLNPKVVAISPTEAYVTYTLTGRDGPPNYFILPSTGRMRHTVNGGQTWNVVSLPFAAVDALDEPVFSTPLTGFVVAYRLNATHLFRTNDGGQSWQNVTASIAGNFRPQRLFFLNAQQGWLTGFDSQTLTVILYKTLDGGQNWSLVSAVGGLPTPYTWDLSFADPLRGMLTSNDSGGGFYGTTDGGVSWTWITTPPSLARLHNVNLRASGAGWAVGPRGSIYRTADYGQTWLSRASLPPVNYYAALAFPDPAHGWAVPQFADIENYTTILRTRRRGEPWQMVSLDGVIPGLSWQNASIRHGAFPDADTAWVAGEIVDTTLRLAVPLILRTTNAGQSWTRQLLPFTSVSAGLTHMGSWNTKRAIATGQFARTLFVTRNGGATWDNIPNPAPRRSPCAVTWADSVTVYIATDSAVYFKSSDAGRTWQVQPTPFGQFIYGNRSFAFTSAQVGYLADGGAIMRTADGGLTWSLTNLQGASSNLNGDNNPGITNLSFCSAQRGLAFGSTDVFETRNGGQNWTKVAYVEAGVSAASTGTAAGGPSVVIDHYNAFTSGSGVVRYSEKYVQVDTTAAQPRQYCAGDTLRLNFATTGTMSVSPADYRLQLSNKMGRFRSGETLTLLPISTSTSRQLHTVLPATLTTGSRYRVRVILADSAVLGGDNERDLTILSRATAVITPAGPTFTICQGETVELTAPAGMAQYQWSTGANTSTITVTAAGLYSVQVASGAGCLGPPSTPVTVNVIPLPLQPLIQQLPTGQLIVVAPVAGASYQWLLNGRPLSGATQATYPASGTAAAGTYTVTATIGGCLSAESAPVVVILATNSGSTPQVALYPNPAHNSVQLVLATAPQSATVELLDAVGKQQWRGEMMGGQLIIPVQQLPAGLYVVRIRTVKEVLMIGRVLVEH
jgi:photosystem II stability/assembly factor-like uncharacterized protein